MLLICNLKTNDGRVLQATIDPSDVQNLKVGDTLQISDIGSTPSTAPTSTSTPNTNTTPSDDTSNSGAPSTPSTNP